MAYIGSFMCTCVCVYIRLESWGSILISIIPLSFGTFKMYSSVNKHRVSSRITHHSKQTAQNKTNKQVKKANPKSKKLVYLDPPLP